GIFSVVLYIVHPEKPLTIVVELPAYRLYCLQGGDGLFALMAELALLNVVIAQMNCSAIAVVWAVRHSQKLHQLLSVNHCCSPVALAAALVSSRRSSRTK